MENNKKIRILIYSLEMIRDFSDKHDSLNSVNEFFEIHERNIKMLTELSVSRDTDYYLLKLNEYPVLSDSEIEEYIKEKRKSTNLILALGGWMFMLVALVFSTIKTKGNNLGGTKNKLLRIKDINESLIYVIKNPGFEELIKEKAMQNNN